MIYSIVKWDFNTEKIEIIESHKNEDKANKEAFRLQKFKNDKRYFYFVQENKLVE